ncbi:alpha/beta hydrolase [Chelativorans xinjiangense]|uniref:alpha/beta hydrolase n=1 Tax=Chelativorans xinjiangense TaxID=2681485 RepID=UPI0013576580|nr:alpha/beta hydrolase [Chelativorans xinjiangense]
MTDSSYHSFRHDGVPGAPVVMAFHGTGGDEYQFRDLLRQMLPDAGIVAPRGDVSEFGANRFFRRTGEDVYDMEDLALRTRKMLKFVAEVQANYTGRPIHAFGYSNGANILASMLFAEPRMFERAALLHPLIPWTPDPQPGLKGKPIFISASLNDPISPLPQSVALIEWFRSQDAGVETLIEAGGHEIRSSEVTALHRFMDASNSLETIR